MYDLLTIYLLGIVIPLILTGCGLPFPEEVFIVAAGVASSLGALNPWLAFGSCVAGALAGDCVIHTIGYHFGHNLVKKHPRFAKLLHAEQEARLEQVVRQHGAKVLFLARFMVGVRMPVYLAAGIVRMPLRRFLMIDAISAVAVVGAFFGLSYAFGKPIAKWMRQGEIWFTVLVILAVVATAYFIWRKGRRLLSLGPSDIGRSEKAPF